MSSGIVHQLKVVQVFLTIALAVPVKGVDRVRTTNDHVVIPLLNVQGIASGFWGVCFLGQIHAHEVII